MTADTTSRDRLYFQQQPVLLVAAETTELEAAALFEDLRLRLESLDEMGESLDLERDGVDIQHHYGGEPFPWL